GRGDERLADGRIADLGDVPAEPAPVGQGAGLRELGGGTILAPSAFRRGPAGGGGVVVTACLFPLPFARERETCRSIRYVQFFPISSSIRVIRYRRGTIESSSTYSSRAW